MERQLVEERNSLETEYFALCFRDCLFSNAVFWIAALLFLVAVLLLQKSILGVVLSFLAFFGGMGYSQLIFVNGVGRLAAVPDNSIAKMVQSIEESGRASIVTYYLGPLAFLGFVMQVTAWTRFLSLIKEVGRYLGKSRLVHIVNGFQWSIFGLPVLFSIFLSAIVRKESELANVALWSVIGYIVFLYALYLRLLFVAWHVTARLQFEQVDAGEPNELAIRDAEGFFKAQ